MGMTRTSLSHLLLLATLAAAGTTCTRPPGEAAPREAPLEGTRWLLAEVGGMRATTGLDGEHVTLQLDGALRRASGFSGVNRFTGSYTLDKGSIRLGPLATTRRAGPPEAEALEQAVLGSLGAATAWRITGGSLALLDATGATLLRFDASPDAR